MRTVRTYISTHRPSRFDEKPPEIIKPIAKRLAYGFTVYIDGKAVGDPVLSSWVKSTEPVFAQAQAASLILAAVDEADEIFELEFILRTAYLRTRINMFQDRLLKEQKGMPVRKAAKDAEFWTDLTRSIFRFKHGIRPGLDGEISELKRIEMALQSDFYCTRRLCADTPPEIQLSLTDE